MRRLNCVLALTLFAVPSIVSAQSPDIRPVELHIVASGIAHNSADLVTVPVTITTEGETSAAASTANASAVATFRRKLDAIGVRGAAVRPKVDRGPGFSLSGMLGGGKGLKPESTSTSLVLRLDSVASLTAVREAAHGDSSVAIGKPVLALKDDRAARAAAIGDAIRHARADAEVYAAAVGMRVAGITRVSNELRPDAQGVLSLITQIGEAMNGQDDDVATRASAVVDFALAPR